MQAEESIRGMARQSHRSPRSTSQSPTLPADPPPRAAAMRTPPPPPPASGSTQTTQIRCYVDRVVAMEEGIGSDGNGNGIGGSAAIYEGWDGIGRFGIRRRRRVVGEVDEDCDPCPSTVRTGCALWCAPRW
jgi:hypothetical protein